MVPTIWVLSSGEHAIKSITSHVCVCASDYPCALSRLSCLKVTLYSDSLFFLRDDIKSSGRFAIFTRLKINSQTPSPKFLVAIFPLEVYLAVYIHIPSHIHRTKFKHFIFYLCCLPTYSGSFWYQYLQQFGFLVVFFSEMCLWPPPPQFLVLQKLRIYWDFWCHP